MLCKRDPIFWTATGINTVSLALAGLLMVGDPAVAGPRIVIAIGLFLSLFGALEGDVGGVFSHIVAPMVTAAFCMLRGAALSDEGIPVTTAPSAAL